MKNLQYNQLLLLSDSGKSGNQFSFGKKLNLITADNNGAGKSTLAKLLLWALGCDPTFDSTWEICDCKVILCFEVDNNPYKVYRHKETIIFQDMANNDTVKYTKVTGDYSRFLNNLLGFDVMLPKRDTSILETPPPAYYFSAFYIDQKKSWDKAWNNFNSLGQYQRWHKNVINYHVGLLTPKHFEIEKLIYQNDELIKNIAEKINNFNIADEVIDFYIPKTNTRLEQKEYEILTQDIKENLVNLSEKEEELLEKLTINRGEQAYLVSQIDITKNILISLEKDYKFAVEYIQDDNFPCPLCGVEHENTAVNRASILTDKEKAEQQLEELNKKLARIGNQQKKYDAEIKNITEEINRINERYIQVDEAEEKSIPKIIEEIATSSLRVKIYTQKDKEVVKKKKIEDSKKEQKKKQREILSKEKREEINNTFSSKLSFFVQKLGGVTANLSKISKPTDYAKIAIEGGAADSTRNLFAYYITIYHLIIKYGNEVVAPLIVDTPNQQEQSLENYDSILDVITKELPEDKQVILCAMKNEILQDYKEEFHIIELNKENRLLDTEKYSEIESEFKFFKEFKGSSD